MTFIFDTGSSVSRIYIYENIVVLDTNNWLHFIMSWIK